jgi:hypothetical protein
LVKNKTVGVNVGELSLWLAMESMEAEAAKPSRKREAAGEFSSHA